MPNLSDLTWVQAKEYFKTSDVALLPVGSTEQHGPQNPLGTDHLIARSLAEEAAKRVDVICLPVIPFGVSVHHMQFWGTIHAPSHVLKAYVKNVCLSLKRYGIHKIVVVNGHGGNTRIILELARELRKKGLFLSVFLWWEASTRILPKVFSEPERGHAAAEETSVNMALHPHLVSKNKLLDEKPREPFAKASVGVSYGLDTADYTSSGVFGISATASVEKGKKVFEAAVKELVRHVNALKKAKIDDLLPKPLV